MMRRLDRTSRFTAAWVSGAVLLLAIGCAGVCETGEACPRTCPTGAIAVCAAHGLCSCLRGPDGGLADADPALPPGRDDSDLSPDGGISPEGGACRAPEPGEIVINEVMLDGEPTEDAEFVELVSTVDVALALRGVTLTSNRGSDQVRRVEFAGGCLPAGAALAVFGQRSDWIESSPAAPPIEAELRSFGFANSGDFDFRLMGGDRELDRFEGLGESIEAGVSLNRWPDKQGDPRAHDLVDPAGSPASPGRCPTGGRYEDGCPPRDGSADPADAGAGADAGIVFDSGALDDPGDAAVDQQPDVFDCPPPEPGELRFNEVLIDGEIPRTEADEFVEIVNLAPTARRLAEVAVAVQAPDGALDVRVRFTDGCLPPAGVMVLRPDIDDWLFDPPPDAPPVVGDARLALGNESRHPLLLLGPAASILDRFEAGELEIVEGVSLNRDPDLSGEAWALHDNLAPTPSSPGRCTDGSPFTVDGCPPPEMPAPRACAAADPSRLVINEILVDGVRDGETDEFVELVNPTDEPVALAGVSLWTSRADGELVRRVDFETGCLPPGALAIFSHRAEWVGEQDEIVADVERLALPNESSVNVELRLGQLRWSVDVPRGASPEGVSVARQSDGVTEAQWMPHDALYGLPASPGLRSDGSPFSGIGGPP